MKITISIFLIVFFANKISAQFEEPVSRFIQISMVSYDLEENKNIIVWQHIDYKDLLSKYSSFIDSITINHYNIFRYDPSQNDYVNIGTLNYNETPVFVDQTSQPDKHAYKYKIQANIYYDLTGPTIGTTFNTNIDSCRYHKTLLVKKKQTKDSIEFIIEPYQIEKLDIQSLLSKFEVTVYRDTNKADLIRQGNEYDSIMFNIGDSIITFIEKDPQALDTSNTFYYMGAVKFQENIDPSQYLNLKASSGPFSQALSNLEDNRLKESSQVKKYSKEKVDGFSVFPNPVTEKTMVSYHVNKKSTVQLGIYTIDGMKIATIVDKTQPAGNYQYNISTLLNEHPASVVIIELLIGETKQTKKIIITE